MVLSFRISLRWHHSNSVMAEKASPLRAIIALAVELTGYYWEKALRRTESTENLPTKQKNHTKI
jgi:hypothetical protein